MIKSIIQLKTIAHARSGDKGNHANIGVIAYTEKGYRHLLKYLTAKKVKSYFKTLCEGEVKRYLLPNIHALNFVLYDSLDGGAGASLRTDSQGKTFAVSLLQIELPGL